MDKNTPSWYITNKVASGNLHMEFDLFKVVETLFMEEPAQVREIEYEPEQFPGAILKLKEPHCSLLIFKNGKIICAGCRNEQEIDKAVKEVYKLLKPLAMKVEKGKKPEFHVQNMVAAGKLGFNLDLFKVVETLFMEEPEQVREIEYEPEQFPGAILKLKEPHCSLLIFKNGKIICAGCRNEQEIDKAVKEVYKLLKRFAE